MARDVNPIAYTFDASAKTVTIVGMEPEKLHVITNITDNVTIYQANDPTKGGVFAGNVLTLDYDTTAMADTDELQVLYEGPLSSTYATAAKQDAQIVQETAAAASLAIIGDWDESGRAMVNIIKGEEGVEGGGGSVTPITQRVVIVDNQDPVAVTMAAPPTGGATEAKQDAEAVLTGAVTETAPATDTASSGLNGRLQRIAQRLTTLIANVGTLVFGAGTEAAALRVTLPTDGTGKVGLNAGTNNIGDVDVLSTPKSSSANTPAIVTSGGDVIASNAARKSWGIQNLGTDPLFVRMATGATSAIFHFCLGPGQAADDGLGASVSDDTYTGVVSATGTSPRFTVYEL